MDEIGGAIDPRTRAKPLRRGRGKTVDKAAVWRQLRDDLGVGWHGVAALVTGSGLHRAAFDEHEQRIVAALKRLDESPAPDGLADDDPLGRPPTEDLIGWAVGACARPVWALARGLYNLDCAPAFGDGAALALRLPERVQPKDADRTWQGLTAEAREWRRAVSKTCESVCRSPRTPVGAKVFASAHSQGVLPTELLAALVTLAEASLEELASALADESDADLAKTRKLLDWHVWAGGGFHTNAE